MMRCLVTGGGGFLGQYVVEQLVARGDTVRSLSRNRYAALDVRVDLIVASVSSSDARPEA